MMKIAKVVFKQYPRINLSNVLDQGLNNNSYINICLSTAIAGYFDNFSPKMKHFIFEKYMSQMIVITIYKEVCDKTNTSILTKSLN